MTSPHLDCGIPHHVPDPSSPTEHNSSDFQGSPGAYSMGLSTVQVYTEWQTTSGLCELFEMHYF